MKNLYLLALCIFLCITLHAQQQSATPSAVATYEQALDQKEDFWSKLKRAFSNKPKPKAVKRTSDPVLVKNDPNRNVQHVPRSHYKTQDAVVEKKGQAEAELPVGAKKSFGQRVNQLVNGKNYVAPKKYNHIKKPAPPEDDFMAMGQKAKAERSARKTNKGEPKTDTRAKSPDEWQRQKSAARQSAQYYASLNKKSGPKVAHPNIAKSEGELQTMAEPEVIDNTIRNEIKPLSLLKTINGTAAYFVPGTPGGKFYVMTNLAAKGSLIKITNPQNGRYLLAEVMDHLSATDAKKGLILKLSDNAKMPLGQNNNSFSVKVNY